MCFGRRPPPSDRLLPCCAQLCCSTCRCQTVAAAKVLTPLTDRLLLCGRHTQVAADSGRWLDAAPPTAAVDCGGVRGAGVRKQGRARGAAGVFVCVITLLACALHCACCTPLDSFPALFKLPHLHMLNPVIYPAVVCSTGDRASGAGNSLHHSRPEAVCCCYSGVEADRAAAG
jgi:hypothetical protein